MPIGRRSNNPRCTRRRVRCARGSTMASMPQATMKTDVPPRSGGGGVAARRARTVRPAPSRSSRQGAAHASARPMLPGAGVRGRPEYDRLKSTLKQLKAMPRTALRRRRAARHGRRRGGCRAVNGQVRSVQRAFGVLADTLEDEVGNLLPTPSSGSSSRCTRPSSWSRPQGEPSGPRRSCGRTRRRSRRSRATTPTWRARWTSSRPSRRAARDDRRPPDPPPSATA